jgi:hypothetical protein
MKKTLNITLAVEVDTDLEGVDDVVNNIEINVISISENVGVEHHEIEDFFEA